MTKRTRKTAKPSKPSKPRKPVKPKGKLGGFREGSGPKPALGPGITRDVIKTLRLGDEENASQQAAWKRAGVKDWATWARPILNAAAEASAHPAPAARLDITRGADLGAVLERAIDHDVQSGGAVVSSTAPCACGHAPEEHGLDPQHPGSTACRAEVGGDPACDCDAYEADAGPPAHAEPAE